MGKRQKSNLSIVGGLGFLRELAIEKPQYLLLGALILLLWGVERWIFSVSIWIPILVVAVATIQYVNHQIQIAVDDLNRKWKRALREAPTTPIENREWLYKLLIHFWPNYFNPMLSTILSTLVENSLKHRWPKLLGKIELQEFSLGTSPPSLALEGARWSTIDFQEMMHLGFEWDTSDMSILLAAKLVRININHLFIKGELQLIPTLDGRAILYSFLTVPEVNIGVAFGSGGSQSLPATELPGVSWLVKLLFRPLVKTMVEPQRLYFILPVHMRKKHQESPADSLRNGSSSDHESPLSAREDEDDAQNLLRRKTIGNGPPEAVFDDWIREINLDLSYHNANNQAFSREHWRLLQCQNGLQIFEELSDVDYLPRSCSRAMKAEGIVDATCEEIFELVMSMDGTRFEWDCTFLQGSLVEEVDGHTAILNHRLQLDWFPMFVWPRDLCYVRYWRRNDDGSYVVLFCSREHDNCAPQPGFVRAHLESGGFNISPMKSLNGRPRTHVQHLMQIDLKGWGVGYLPSFQQHCLLQMLNCVAGLREYFAQTDERTATPRIPVMVKMKSVSVTSRKGHKRQESSMISGYLDQVNVPNRNSVMLDDYSDEDEDFQIAEPEEEMAAFNIQEALVWKEKIEQVIDQHQESPAANGNKYLSFEYESGADSLRNGSSSDHESPPSAREDEDDARNLLRRKTIGNGPPEAVFDWTREINSDLSYHSANNQAFSRKHWRLLQCQNGLRIFEELSDVDYLPRSCSRAMKAEGIVDATCEEIFELIMSMDGTRYEWDCTYLHGCLIEEVDGHTAILYHRLQLDLFPRFVWPRDLCYVRYWRRNDDGSYVVLFCSREHDNCAPQPGFVRAHLESGGFNISPMKSLNGRPRTQVQHLMQIDLKGWGVGYLPSFQQHCLLQMLNCVAGLREYFVPTDERTATPRIPLMVNMKYVSVTSRKGHKRQESSMISGYLDDYSDEDEDFQIALSEEEVYL